MFEWKNIMVDLKDACIILWSYIGRAPTLFLSIESLMFWSLMSYVLKFALWGVICMLFMEFWFSMNPKFSWCSSKGNTFRFHNIMEDVNSKYTSTCIFITFIDSYSIAFILFVKMLIYMSCISVVRCIMDQEISQWYNSHYQLTHLSLHTKFCILPLSKWHIVGHHWENSISHGFYPHIFYYYC